MSTSLILILVITHCFIFLCGWYCGFYSKAPADIMNDVTDVVMSQRRIID